MTNTLCKIQMLGGLRVQIEEREITRFSTQKTACLLAYLAYYRHQSHPREVLIEMLWPECEPKVGRYRLSNALYSLRKLLEQESVASGAILTSTHFAIGLNPSIVTTDVADFLAACRKATRANDPAERKQSLHEAADAYSGDLLPGFYEDWVLTEQRRLAELFEQVQRDLRARAKQESIHAGAMEETLQSPSAASTEPISSLPTTFTRFFGRTELLEELHQRLSPASPLPSRPHLVTITGTGGMGKTRLSLEVARGLVEDYSGAVWFVPLADVSDPALIGSALVDALSLPRSGNMEPLEQAITFLRERQDAPSLLVLDNFEQLVEGGAEIVQTLLEQVPALTCLVTSRRLLNLTHEQEIVLQPLPTPRGEVSPDHLTMYESVRLFIDRAKTVRPTFSVTNQNGPDVAELCYRLEGIPLAIELAAARAQVLTPAQIRAQLQQRFAFLVSRKRDVVKRHQTLHAAIEWSYRLLAPELQRFFVRLSVFRGGWTLEAAEAVCEEVKALEYLEQLREWSLVQVEESVPGIRFTILEMLREFGREKLVEAGEETNTRKRHVEYFLELAEQVAPKLEGSEQAELLFLLEKEHDNMGLALDWLANDPEGGQVGLRLAGALGRYWIVRGHWREGSVWSAVALSHPGAQARTKERGDALNSASFLASRQNDYTAALALGEEALAIRREIGDQRGIAGSLHNLSRTLQDQAEYARACLLLEEALILVRESGSRDIEATILNSLGVVAAEQGDFISAQKYYEESLALNRNLGYPKGIATALSNLGSIFMRQGDLPEARACYEESLSLKRPVGNKYGLASTLVNLGLLACIQGDYAEARSCLAESLELCRELGDLNGVAYGLEYMADLAQAQGVPARAVRLLGAGDALREAIGTPIPLGDQPAYDDTQTSLRASLGEREFEQEWEAGRAMMWEEAIAYALEDA